MRWLTMHRIDDFLIDKVFQRVSDALCRWRSCYGIAAFLMTGGAVAILGSDVWLLTFHTRDTIDWIGMVIFPWLLYWLMTTANRAYRLDLAWESGQAALPGDRLHGFWGRIIFAALSLGDRFLELTGVIQGAQLVSHFGWACITCAFYFLACTPKRPRRQTQTQHAWNSA